MDSYKGLKIGDIVKDFKGSIWGEKLFVVDNFHGNDFLPLFSAYLINKPKTNKYMVNLNAKTSRLISTTKRPFIKLNNKALAMLLKKGNAEARRELEIRFNSK